MREQSKATNAGVIGLALLSVTVGVLVTLAAQPFFTKVPVKSSVVMQRTQPTASPSAAITVTIVPTATPSSVFKPRISTPVSVTKTGK